MKNKSRKCIKGFDSELKCRDFQYEVGKSYKLPKGEHVKICKNGFHAIDEDENPLDVFGYYPPCGDNGNPSRYCEVEIGGEIQKDGSKIVGSKIKIMREIGFQGVIDAHRKWVKRHPEVGVSEENDDNSVASNTGNYSVASNTGFRSVASNTGFRSVASNTGFRSVASNVGYRSVASNTGDNSVVSNTGDNSLASNNGVHSAALNNGKYSCVSVKGKDSVAVASGYEGCVKGLLGCLIVAVERSYDDQSIQSFAAGMVDGVNIKADTWYTCVDGKLVEACEYRL